MLMEFAILFLLTFLLTGGIRLYALDKKLIDIPNDRSSHTIPTPRGGGVAFVIGFLLCAWYCRVIRIIEFWPFVGFFCIGLGAAILGFIDDSISLSPRVRLLWHFIFCGLALYCLGGMPSIVIGGYVIGLPAIVMNFFALIYLVWFLNLYNFMDGIDGIAAIEALSICLGGTLIYLLQGEDSMVILPFMLSLAVSGFLFWNFPRARIFMGDTGSCFLGLVIGMFTIQAAHVDIQYFYAWLILSGVFLIDATITLLRRLFDRQAIQNSHRTHAYQHATELFKSHFNVSIFIFFINTIWLLPIAILVGTRQIDGVLGLLIAYLPLIVLAFQFNAGKTK